MYQGPEGYKRYIAWITDEFEDAHVSGTVERRKIEGSLAFVW